MHHALEDMGFRYVVTAANIAGAGIIPASVTAEPGLVSRATDIVKSLPFDLQGSVNLTVDNAPVVANFQSFGGGWVADGTVDQCTSGWSVIGVSSGVRQVTTAAHCVSIDKIRHPGHGTHSLTYNGQHLGAYGDVEKHESIGQTIPDDFYADASTVRDVAGVQPRASIHLGDNPCVYGRRTNFRSCSMFIQDVSTGCTRNGVFVDRLVMMNDVRSDVGDSGGGWSLGNYAWGSVVGVCHLNYTPYEVWSVADLYDEALGVRVMCGAC